MRRIAKHIRWLASTSRDIQRWRRGLLSYTAKEDKLRLACLSVILTLRLLRSPIPVLPMRLTLRGSKQTVHVGNHYEFAAAFEVLCTSDYVLRSPADGVRRILDLGANVGFATLRYASEYPGAQIVAVEPAPDTFERLSQNVQGLSNVRAMQLAVGSPGLVQMDLSTPSSERRETETPDVGITAQRVSLADLLDVLEWDSVDAIKIDIEGDEFAVLQEQSIARAGEIVGELHSFAAPERFESLHTWLPTFDVTHEPLSGRDWVMFHALTRTESHDQARTPK